jgi:hypothetical protein
MVATGREVSGVLQRRPPLAAQLRATLNTFPTNAWYGVRRKQIRIEMFPMTMDSIHTLIPNDEAEVIYGNE